MRAPASDAPSSTIAALVSAAVAVGFVALVVLVLLVLVRGTSASADSEAAWRWPLEGKREVVRPFDPPEERWLPGHRGVDLAADEGAVVMAAGAGRVAFAGPVAGTGVVSIAHGELRTTYLPVEAEVERGDPVDAGDVIGTVAAAPRHCGRRACLHWGLLRDRAYLDPLALLGMGEIRLLPVLGTGRASRAGVGLVVGAGEPLDGDVGVDLGAAQ
ncbi:hypothetical protein CDO52_08930 [Nocardiopsis gilva YIM 90087]|uniref:M23ase beta-sheet core domain-containing protein n=1 Tax=Nocardiopsis gilva YIM 90087 TaxID=1235441 RepID=A0A223S440_9ACTN|nr:M23 family metallopeptidase [Nocardiopsis gilva]ASU82892.1 hypothetical protein CDO52_08930 [Nocardiopsis gilva YIM 90087]